MEKFLAIAALLVLACALPVSADDSKDAKSPLDFKVKSIDGKDVDLADYKG